MPAGGDGFELPDQGLRMEELEVSLIEQALSKTAGNRSRAARLLGLTRDTLLYRMKKYEIA
jgi:transcriptional regulator with PAS, ATPase and Fis domain